MLNALTRAIPSIAAAAVTFGASASAGTSPSDVSVYYKSNLAFAAADFAGPRPSETFQAVPQTTALASDIEKTVRDVEQWLPSDIHANPMTIYMEDKADVVYPDSTTEGTPLSIVTGMQDPPNNAIRLGVYEIAGDSQAICSVLAHEMGHMLVEWASRQAGTTPASQQLFSHWDKAIYEGVADFISAVTTGKTIIGGGSWFTRDILRYKTLAEAKSDRLTLNMANAGFASEGFVPRYRVYTQFLDDLTQIFKDPSVADPYAVGDWVAMQLWLASKNGSAPEAVIHRLLKLAQDGTDVEDPVTFVSLVTLASSP